VQVLISSGIQLVSQRPEPLFINQSDMRNQKKTTTFTTVFGETLTDDRIGTENGLRIIKIGSDSLSMETFTIFIPFTGTSIETVVSIFEIAMQYPDHDVFKKTFHALANQNQGLKQAYQQN
jgi:hypothetical protein